MLVVISLVSSSPCCVLCTQTNTPFNVTTRLYSTRKHIKTKPEKKLLSLGPGPFTQWFRAALRRTAKTKRKPGHYSPVSAIAAVVFVLVVPPHASSSFTLLKSAYRGFCNPWTAGGNQPSTWGDIPVKGKVYIYIDRGADIPCGRNLYKGRSMP